jgi:hypothetical protein
VARDAKLEKRDFGLGDRKAVNEHEGKHRRAAPPSREAIH